MSLIICWLPNDSNLSICVYCILDVLRVKSENWSQTPLSVFRASLRSGVGVTVVSQRGRSALIRVSEWHVFRASLSSVTNAADRLTKLLLNAEQ